MRESIQVHKELGVFKIKFFEGAWEDPYRREAIQMLEECDKSFSKSDHLELE